MNFSVQVLAAHDWPLARSLFDLWRRGDGVTAPPAPDAMLQRLLGRQDFHVLAALHEGEVIGGLTAYELTMYTENATELLIYEVGVEEAFRRQGVGRALLEGAKQLCRERDLRVLSVPSLADDARAVAFYAGIGLKREDVAWFSEKFGPAP